MSFNEINPDTGKSWTRAELFEELEKQRAKTVEILKEVSTYSGEVALTETAISDIISWPAQAANLRARWAIHLDESSIAVDELKSLGRSLRVFYENQKEYWTNSPLLKQQQ